MENAADPGDWKNELKREIMSELTQTVKDAVNSALHPGHDHETEARHDQDQDLSASDMEMHDKSRKAQSLGTILDDADSLEKALE